VRKVARASQSLISPPFFINQNASQIRRDLKYAAKIGKFVKVKEVCFFGGMWYQ